MGRFYGLLPRSAIEIQKSFNDGNGSVIRVEAGPTGWTVIWADRSTDFADVADSSLNNYNSAVSFAKQYFPDMVEICSREKTFNLVEN
jgi:hypothetical protein